MITKFKKGIIVSIQGYSEIATKELALHAINGGAVAIKTDKNIHIDKVPIIGLKRVKVQSLADEVFMTPTIKDIDEIKIWSEFIALDFRMLNPDLAELIEYCRHNQLNVIANIGSIDDYLNIVENNWKVAYISTALSVFYLTKQYFPDKILLKELVQNGCKNIIAEGNYQAVNDVREAYTIGSNNVCMGGYISDIYKLTKKYTRISEGWKPTESVNTAYTVKDELHYNR